MTTEQNQHMEFIASRFAHLMKKKYEKGQAEHGGNLWDIPAEEILKEAINEAIDQVVYLITLEQILGNELEAAWRYKNLRES